jgi:integrase
MREASSPSTTRAATRRRAVGPKWPGVYERHDHRGARRLEVDFYDEAGRRRWRSLPAGTTLGEAQAAREKLRVRRREGERFAPAKSPTIAESWPRWLDEAAVSLRPRTVAGYRHAFAGRIVPRIGRVRVGKLDRHDVLGLIRQLQRDGLAAWTIRGTLVPLALFCTWAEDAGLRRGNPVRELRRRERPRVAPKPHRQLVAEDLWRLVGAADDGARSWRCSRSRGCA